MSEFLLFYLFIIVFVVLISWLACLLKIIPGAWYIILLGSNHARRTHTKHPSSAVGGRSEPHAFSNAHIPKHPSSAGSERREPHAFSNTHTPTTLRAQAAERSEPHALPNAHIPSTLRCVNLLVQLCSPCIYLRNPTWLTQRVWLSCRNLNRNDSVTRTRRCKSC